VYHKTECEGFQCDQAVLEAGLDTEQGPQGVIERLVAWLRKRSLFVLAYGTGCGAIEMRPLMTSRFDAERFGIINAATPGQAPVPARAAPGVRGLSRLPRQRSQPLRRLRQLSGHLHERGRRHGQGPR